MLLLKDLAGKGLNVSELLTLKNDNYYDAYLVCTADTRGCYDTDSSFRNPPYDNFLWR